MAEVKFKIIEVTDVNLPDGKKFKGYKTVGKGGRKMDVRFVRDCKNVPTAPCTIVVEADNANVDTTRQYPILWVKDVIRCEESEHKKSNLADFFD